MNSKLYLYQFFLLLLGIIVMGSCDEPKSTPLHHYLAVADSAKYNDAGLTEMCLSKAMPLMDFEKHDDSYATYYFLKAFVAFDAGDEATCLAYMDSSTYGIHDVEKSSLTLARVSLLKALMHSEHNENDLAYWHALKALKFFEKGDFENDEFITLLVLVRTMSNVNQDSYRYLRRALKLNASQHFNDGLCFMYQSSISTSVVEKRALCQKADAYFNEHRMYDRLFVSYCNTAEQYIKAYAVDTAAYYLNAAQQLGGGEGLLDIKPKRRAQFYFLKASLSSAQQKDELALIYLKKTINQALYFDQEGVLYQSFLLKSSLHQQSKDYKEALVAYQKSTYYQKMYRDKQAHDKVNMINASVNKSRQEAVVESYKQKRRIHLLSIALFGTLTILALFLVYTLYNERKRLRTSVTYMKQKHSSSTKKLTQTQNKLVSIKQCLGDQTKSYASCYRDVKHLIDENALDFDGHLFENTDVRQVVFSKFPQVTESEFRYIACVFMHVDRPNILKLLSLKPDSLKTKEKRLKKKLMINSSQTLKSYILTHLQE